MHRQNDGVAIISGGLDSVTMAYHLVDHGYTPRLISFNYGQRHAKELFYAQRASFDLDLQWDRVDLSSVGRLFTTSALTFGQEVPEGHYAEDNMAATVVPNRNMIMMAIATGLAVNDKLSYIAAGMHAGDHAQYPDCRPPFLDDFLHAAKQGNKGFMLNAFRVTAPWIYLTKNDIAQRAFELGVPLAQTWSCYKGGVNHCGRCGTCVERLEAIASVEDAPPGWDQTVYDDAEYWKTAVGVYKAAK